MLSDRPAVVRVAHENAVIGAGLRHILGAWPEFEVQPPSASGPLDPAQSDGLDLIVLDHDRGIRWAMNHHRHPASCANVLVVAMMGQEAEVRNAMEAGVRGYVLIGCSEEEIVRAARAVAAGRRHLCSAATLRMADSLAEPGLTRRESEVLALIFRGRNNKEVARSLGISVGTVKSHMRGLLAKLGARCRTEALWIASQRGLIVRSEEVDSASIAASKSSPSAGSWPASRPAGAKNASNLRMLQASAA